MRPQDKQRTAQILLLIALAALFAPVSFAQVCTGGLGVTGALDCTGTSSSACHYCDVNAMQFQIRAPDDTNTTAWIAETYSTGSGTCSSGCADETWLSSYGYTFCHAEGAYDARTKAGSQNASGYSWETSDWNTNVYTVNWDTSSDWCQCRTGSSANWFSTVSGGSNGSCCGDDTTSDDFYYYSADPTTATSLACTRCSDGTKAGPTTLYGNGYWGGTDKTTDTSGTCYYGDINCTASTAANGTSGTYYGNGYTTASQTSDLNGLCYYGDITCANGSAANGSSLTLYGNGSVFGTTCIYGDWTCANGSDSNGSSCTLACSGLSTTCCATQAYYRDTIACAESGCGYTDHDRDDGEAYCTASSSKSVSDSFTDETKVASKTDLNVDTSAGQVKLNASSQAWWNSSWGYRKPVTINNTGNSNTLTNYQVFVNVSFVSGKMKSDFNDLRFYDHDSNTALSYWIENYVASSDANVWVKVPSIPASSNKTIYMYYENGSATSDSNAEAVMLVYDDFASGTEAWTGPVCTGYSLSNSSGTAYLLEGASGDYLCDPVSRNGQEGSMEKTVTKPTGVGLDVQFDWRATSDTDGSTVTNAKISFLNSSDTTLSSTTLVAGGTADTGWNYDYNKAVISAISSETSITIVLGFWDSWTLNHVQKNYYDNIQVRQFTTPTPSASLGTEEVKLSYATSGTLTSTNLLSGYTFSSIDQFGANASSIPAGTTLKVQFSQNNSTWYNSSGSAEAWNTLSQGYNSISLSSLGWSGSNFYYKAQFDSNGSSTPLLDDINVYQAGTLGEATGCTAYTWDSTGSKCCGDDNVADSFCTSGGGSCISGSWTANHCLDGVKNCDEIGIDNGGADCNAEASDTTAPVTTSDANEQWQTANQTITLACSDGSAVGASGCQATYYCIDDYNTCEPSVAGTTAQVNCNSDDVNRQFVRFYSLDYNSNVEDVKSAYIKIDKQKPSTDNNISTAWVDSNVHVKLSCTDYNGSGCALTQYRQDTNPSKEITWSAWANYSTAIVFGSDGNYAIDFNSTDNVGNMESSSRALVKIDKGIAIIWPMETYSYYSTYDGNVIVQFTQDGNHQLDFNSRDVAGNAEQVRTVWVAIDKTPPVTTDDLNTAWQTANFSIALTCNDKAKECTSIGYRLDSSASSSVSMGAWAAYSTPISISTDGNWALDYNATDYVGWVEATHRIYALLDKTAPSTTDDANTSWHNSNFNVTLSASDATSGIKDTLFCLSTGTCTPSVSGNNVAITCQSGAVCRNYLYYLSTDVAGNIESTKSTGELKIDRQNPIVVSDANTACHLSDQTVHLSSYDWNGSGIAATYYCVDDTNTCTPSASGTTAEVSCDANSLCPKYVRYNATDLAGNSSVTYSAAITVDKGAPTTTTDANTAWKNSNQMITLTPSDGVGCGVAATYYCTDDTNTCAPTTSGTSVSIDCNASSVCQKYLRYYSVDIGGSTESVKAVLVRIDRQAPSVSHDANTAWVNSNQTVHFTINDGSGAGGTQAYYCTDDVNSCNPSMLASSADVNCDVNAVCQKYLRFKGVDTLGNQGETAAVKIRIDKNAPMTASDVNSAWRSTNHVVYLTANDTGSGVQATYYCGDITNTCTPNIADTSFTVYALDNQVVVSYARYYSKDNAGNSESIHSDIIRMDKQKPATTDDSNSTWQKTDVTVHLTPGDGSGCGIASTYYCVDDSNSCTPTTGGTSASVTCEENSVCQKYVRYYSTDSLGNTETTKSSTVIRIDKNAPYTAADLNAEWYGGNQNVTLTPTDGSGSGIAATYYCTDDTNACAPTTSGTSASFSCDANSVCLKYLRYYSKDNAGNNEAVHGKPVNIDSQNPASAAVFEDGWHGDFNVQVSCNDYNGSGCSTLKYRIDSGAWTEQSFAGNDSNILLSTDGNHLVEYSALDLVDNNSGIKQGWLAVDKNPPSITITDPSTDLMEKGTPTISFNIGRLGGSVLSISSIVVDFNGTPSDDFVAAADCNQNAAGDYNCSYTELSFPETDYNLSVYAKDAANNARKASRVFTLKAVISARNITPSGGLVKGASTVQFEVKNTLLNTLYAKIFVSNWFNEFDSNISGVLNLNDHESIAGLSCDSTDWWTWTECTYDWNTLGTADGNYFIDLNLYNASGGTATAHSAIPFLLDNTPPAASVTDVSSTPVYLDRVYLGCSDAGSGCKQTKWYYFATEPSCSTSKSAYALSTTADYLDIATDHSDYICLWAEDFADFNARAVSAQLHVETGVYVVSSIPSESLAVATQDLNNECRMYLDQNITVECAFQSTIKISEYEKDLNRVWPDSPSLVVSPAKTIRVLVQSELEAFYNKDYFLKFESNQRTITSLGNEREYPTVVVRRRVIPLLTTAGQLEVGTLTIKVRQK
ncbi:MAG: DUF2341 domain-containing protein [Candidatus Diapherotrites archaeon]|nr:DUF2341 domain-containing protein [Candidatus Diapherotrites archaeon]